jgi:hypothetical protein
VRPVEPELEQFQEMQEIAGGADDGPIVMLNLNRYRDRDAYARYGEVALRVLQQIGGRVLWQAPVQGTVVGDDSDSFDDVLAVWYPSAAAFLALATNPEILEAREHRLQGLERAAILRCDGAGEPELPAPSADLLPG